MSHALISKMKAVTNDIDQDTFGSKDIRQSIGKATPILSSNGGNMHTTLNVESKKSWLPVFNSIDRLSPESWPQMRNAVWNTIQHYENKDPMIFDMLNSNMQRRLLKQITVLNTWSKAEKPWLLDGKILTGKKETALMLKDVTYDRMMCLIYLVCHIFTFENEMDIRVQQVVSAVFKEMTPFPSLVQNMWLEYPSFHFEFEAMFKDLLQATNLMQFMQQASLELTHKGKRSDISPKTLTERHMDDLGANEVLKFLIKRAEYPGRTREYPRTKACQIL